MKQPSAANNLMMTFSNPELFVGCELAEAEALALDEDGLQGYRELGEVTRVEISQTGE